MKVQIRIDLLDADLAAMLRTKSILPPGIQIEGPISTALHEKDKHPVRTFIVVTIVLPITLNLAANTIYDWLATRKVTRISIERQEIHVNHGEIEKVIREKIQIEQ